MSKFFARERIIVVRGSHKGKRGLIHHVNTETKAYLVFLDGDKWVRFFEEADLSLAEQLPLETPGK